MLALVAFVSVVIFTLGQEEPPVAEETDKRANILELGEEVQVKTPEWANVYQPRSAVNTVGGTWVAQGPGPATNGQTENVSPNNEISGAVHVVLSHPSNANILYAGGTNGGVWKTTSATSNSPSWTPLTDNMPSNSIGALDFDYNDTSYQTVWAGIGRFSSYSRVGGLRTGLLKTTNGGTSWSVVNGGGTLNGKNISGLVVRGNTVLVAVNIADSFTYSNIGIFRSTDGGNSFSQISVGDGSGASGLPGGLSYDIAANPNIPGVVYTVMDYADGAGGTNGIYRSSDFGATWSKVSTPEMDSLITSGSTSNVEIALGDSGSVFVAILNSGQLRGGGTYYSPTGDSNTFVAMDKVLVNEGGGSVGTNPRFKPNDGEPGGQGSIHFSITVDPTNDEVVYVGGDRQPRGFQDQGNWPNALGAYNYSGRLFRGDAGVEATGAIPSPQWEHLTHTQNAGGMSGGGTASNSSPHADSRHMDFDANGNLIESDDGGIYRRTNPSSNTGDWFSLNGNLQTNEQHDVAYDHIANVIMSGNQDNGSTVQSSSGSTNWTAVSTADGGDIAIGVNPSNTSQSVRYSSFQNLGAFARRVYNSSNQLLSTNYPSLTLINGSDPMAVQFVTPVELNVIESQRLIFGASNGIYESQDEGATINRLSSTGVSSALGGNTMVFGGRKDGINNADFIFAALSGSQTVGVRTSASGEIIEYSTPADSSLRGVAADPDDWNRLFIIDQDQVFMSTDAGVNWTDITGDLPAGFTTVDLHALDFVRAGSRGAVLVGGINGVYVATDNDFSSWSKIGAGLPIVPVWDMDYDRTDDVLVAGTLGRGSWSLNNVAESLFGPITPEYQVTPIADANGSIDPSTVQTVIEGDTVSFTLIPDGGFQIKLPIEGTCGGDLSGNVFRTSPITQNCTVTASFEPVPATQYVVTPFADANGSISPSTDQTVAEGERATFTITPDSGYQIKLPVGGTCGGTLSGTTYTTSPVTQNCTVNANFELIPSTQYTVTPSAGANGSISPATAQSVTQGATATFTITPDSGYQTKLPVGGTCGGDFSEGIYTTNAVTGDCSVSAQFETVALPQYTVTPTFGDGGSIIPAVAQVVTLGSTVSFEISVNTGFSLGPITGTCPTGSLTGSTYTTGAISGDCGLNFDFTANAVPTNPLINGVEPGDEEAYLFVSADGNGSAILSFTATCTDGTSDFLATRAYSPIIVSGLKNGTPYTCSVTATNASGTSSPSASVQVIPEASGRGLPLWLLLLRASP